MYIMAYVGIDFGVALRYQVSSGVVSLTVTQNCNRLEGGNHNE